MAQALRDGRKVLLFGNGGSAADAQHIAAEFVGRFIPDRIPLPALSLATDTSALTALGNDYGYNAVFSRQVQAWATPGTSRSESRPAATHRTCSKRIDVARAQRTVDHRFYRQRAAAK